MLLVPKGEVWFDIGEKTLYQAELPWHTHKEETRSIRRGTAVVQGVDISVKT